jgi:hypothetical protein
LFFKHGNPFPFKKSENQLVFRLFIYNPLVFQLYLSVFSRMLPKRQQDSVKVIMENAQM